jgi:hypothetical protein
MPRNRWSYKANNCSTRGSLSCKSIIGDVFSKFSQRGFCHKSCSRTGRKPSKVWHFGITTWIILCYLDDSLDRIQA